MSKLRVHSFAMSIDGYRAGPNQSLENPLGAGGLALHEWAFATRTFQQMFAKDGGATGINDDFVARGFSNIGAWILGRNMFGPVRGPWSDANWKGWWGDNPPYHTPVFVLTHYARESFTTEGGTTFHFVTDGIHSALQRAVDAANGLDVRLGGGVATIKQYLRAGLWMRRTWPLRRFCSAPASSCSRTLTCRGLATGVSNTHPRPMSRMSCSREQASRGYQSRG